MYMMVCFTEEIVMTPTKKGKMTCIHIEKVQRNQLDSTQVAHQGGGANSGLVINKKAEGMRSFGMSKLKYKPRVNLQPKYH